jgi:hypothetical protein
MGGRHLPKVSGNSISDMREERVVIAQDLKRKPFPLGGTLIVGKIVAVRALDLNRIH